MKQARMFLLIMIILALSAPAVLAEESRKKLLMDAVEHGVKVLETKGKAGMEELRSYKFANGEGYLYILTPDWVMLMHPAKELVNKDTTTTKDAKGKYFGAEMKAKANKSGHGWTSYWWPNAQKNNEPELKCSYYKTANMGGQKVVVAAGLYGIPEGECQ